MPASIELLAAHLIEEAGPLLVVTGAGVSAASGLPLFRGSDPDAVWNRDITERGTLRYFWEDPVASWSWYLARFDALLDAEPNHSHRALADLERWQTARGGEFLLVTQNVDGLHRDAGSEATIEVHGRADRVRCASKGCINGAPRGSLPGVDFAAFRSSPIEANIPTCDLCGELLRPHILWFDERYDEHRDYRIADVLRFAKGAKTVLFAGTSFSVGVTSSIMETSLRRGARIFSVDLSGRSPHRRVEGIEAPAESALPALLELLR